jgi:hypothetical protein
MIKFIGNGIVWDAERNRPLAEFKDGIFETEDMQTAAKLAGLGYEHDRDIIDTTSFEDAGEKSFAEGSTPEEKEEFEAEHPDVTEKPKAPKKPRGASK